MDRLYAEKLRFISGALSRSDKRLAKLQRELFDYLTQEYLPLLDVVDGVVQYNEKNAKLLLQLDNYLAKFKQTTSLDSFAKLGQDMLRTTELTTKYYRAMVGGKATVTRIRNRLNAYRAFVGVDKAGNVIPGSFIDHLAEGGNIRLALSQYIQKSIEGGSDYKTFVNGMKDLVSGSDEVDGAYERYVGGYANDAFNAQAQSQDNFFADQLGLNYFVYEGELVKDSRPFCKARHGKTFHRDVLEEWDRMEWQGKIPDVPVIEQRGGYNCRHIIRWIPDEYGEENIAEETE